MRCTFCNFTTHGVSLSVGRRLAILFLLFFLPAFCLPLAAAGAEDLLSDLLATLPEGARAELTGGESASELVGIEHLFSLVMRAVGDALGTVRPFAMTLFGAVLLFSVLPLLFREAEGGLLRILEVGMAAALLSLLYPQISADMQCATVAVTDMCTLSDALIPAFSGIFLAGGSPLTAAASSAAFVGFSLLLENAAAGLLLPLLRVLFAFTLLSAAVGRVRTEGIFSSLRRLYVTLLGFLSLLLTTSLAFQGTLAASSDSLSVRSVKFALGRMIPIIGGSLAESLRTLTASLSLLKSTVGGFSVVALLAIVLPSLVTLLVHRFLLSLAAAGAGMLGGARAERVISELRGLYDLAVATLAISLVLFLLILALLARLGVALAV